ncbi:hypothetical protein HGG74_17430 [Arthrobacter sp. E918]|uniref:Recombination endonuclease VII n=2 Tax=Arthrobacter mobilis TaxID=2724944 RepID=A0A7X6HFT1_9MICC|nr:hypothetical protein [Arthrobacter mobilis]
MVPLPEPWLKLNRAARDDKGNKQCTRCKRWLPESAFGSSKSAPDELKGHCRQCEADRLLLNKYGLTVEQYEALLAMQGGVCAICQKPPLEGVRLCVDHDHGCCDETYTCGQCVRGLLHADCNAALGYFNDSVDFLRAAIEYLTRGTIDLRDIDTQGEIA